jgi:predicted neuraminidase
MRTDANMKLRTRYFLLLILTLSFYLPGNQARTQTRWELGVVKSELIFREAPFKQCHASTISETRDGLIVAFFAGTEERNPDVAIWSSRLVDGTWTPPAEVANGIQPDGTRLPCWNPVLFQIPQGELLLFYKVGPEPSRWWGMLIRSTDGGKSWSHPERLPSGILGPIKNKPVRLSSGKILLPSSTEENGWRVHVESTSNGDRRWKTTGFLDGGGYHVIQPTILIHGDGKLQMLCRSRENCIVESWSSDEGETWSTMAGTALPNPNSGIDAVTLSDGRQLLVYNHSTVPEGQWGGPRSPLNIVISNDGKTWFAAVVLENGHGEFSYPAVIQTRDSMVHVTYTWKRSAIKHVVIDPSRCKLTGLAGGAWPDR